jgi:RimJ/RimL family protein N-acetyltransferase
VADQMLRFPYPYGRRHAAAFLGRPETHFAVEANRALAGGIGLSVGRGANARTAELSYWLGEPFWGHGIASAAVRVVTAYAFRTLRLRRVLALPFVDNRASGRVLEKAGFRREATHRGSAARNGVVHDQSVYALTNDSLPDHDGAERRDEADEGG